MSFSVARLLNHRAQVSGTDVNSVTNSTVLDTTQWDELKADEQYRTASDEFDAKVKDFFSDLVDAIAERDEQAVKVAAVDPVTYVEIEPGVDAVLGRAPNRVKLNKDSQILRLIESKQDDRLVWVGNDLEILAVELPDAELPVTAADVNVDAVEGLFT